MNKQALRKVALVVVPLLIVVAGVFYFTNVKGKKPGSVFINPAFGEYITSYTAGLLSSDASVRITFANNVVDSAMVGQESDVRLFSFSPSVSGKTVWLEQNTVEFRPDEKLKSGQVYEVSLYLSKLIDELPGGLETFEYTFQVIPQNFLLTVDNVKPYVKTELRKLKVEGSLVTADVSSNEAVEQMMTASQNDRQLKLSWTHSTDGKQHQFVVEDVERKEEESKVILDCKGAPIGAEGEEKQEVEIVALGDFKVVNTKVVQSPNQYVVVQFSDPLKEKQDLSGLITIEDLPNLDFEIRDNEVLVYPPVRQSGSKTLTVNAGVRNILDYKMKEGSSATVAFEQLDPAVRFVGKGNILPSTNGLVLPFEAVSLKSVTATVIRIYEKNVLQFLQVNELDGNQQIRRVGKKILTKSISLESSGVTDIGRWNRYTLDLTSLITPEPGAIYQVRLSFKKSDAALSCGDTDDEQSATFASEEIWSEPEGESSYWDSYESYYYDEDYDWNQRNNPCNSSYYTRDKSISRNILASDMGIITKRGGDGKTIAFLTDLKTTEPLSGVTVELYDFQQQVLASGTTDGSGRIELTTKETPFVLVARNGAQLGYLKIPDGEALSMSNFDVGGEYVQKGLKGFLYGDRGVWRPGDSLFMTLIIEDRLKTLPRNHPVVFELENPQGQVASRIVRSNNENGFYKLATATESDAPTGDWTARVKVGGTTFTQPVKIETVKPNRLKINLDFGVDRITAEANNVRGTLGVNWLHGAVGKNLKAQFEVLLTKGQTRFDKFPDYTFEDPSRTFSSEAQTIFDGETDEDGKAVISTSLETTANAPGVLNAIFRGKVFEESGNFSVDRFSLPYYPFTSYTGIRLPPGDKARGMLLTDTTHTVDVVTIDAFGKAVNRDKIEMSVYKISWRWWWDNSGEEAVYVSDSESSLVASGTTRTNNGKGTWKFKISYPEWGRYLVRAYDPVSGHATAKIVYIDWPGWAGRSRGGNEGATMLTFNSDKPVYQTGEKASIVIPSSGEGRALVSVENGTRVLRSEWVKTQKGDTPFSFDVTSEMTPNVFVHVTLIQPHAQTTNDLPMRLYGVIPVQVEDKNSRLQPIIQMPDVLEPGKEVTIRVSEQAKKKMTYTIAVVDEGLLDLTRFKTPDPWKRFYAREALGVKTWDLYDQVVGSFGSRIERLLSIGGDMEAAKEDDPKANRFKPVVKYLGPFTIDGDEGVHKFIMPQYIGSVRTMVVAGYNGAYGSVEKATPVRKPLMVLATLPRVLGPDEKVKLPVTLFTMDKNIKNVQVTVDVKGPLSAVQKTQQVNMNGSDQTIEFDLAVLAKLGVGKVSVTATSGNFKATDEIDIEVRNPNPPVTRVTESLLEQNKSWSASIVPVGMAGTNAAILELSTLPPINLGERLKYLLQYPYGCIEQTTSSVFPQLYVENIKQLSEGEKSLIQKNVKAGIDRLKSFQLREGGFGYWPGAEGADSWGTTYAGHFLTEAELRGYVVPADMLKKWKKFERNRAQAWRRNGEPASGELIQAYRLYALANAGEPDLSSMNRLRELPQLPLTASWMLAAAYAKAGQPEAAKKLIASLPTKVKPYQEMFASYGSDLRDKAIILETLLLTGERTKAFEVLKEISSTLSNSGMWLSTQTVAWCLKSASAFASEEKGKKLSFAYTWNGKEVTASTDLPYAQVSLPVDGAKAGSLKVVSQTGATLFARVITTGTPARGEENDDENNLSIMVSYTNLDGFTIDPTQLEQGSEFIASVTVTNPGGRGLYKNMALNQIFPSGWEINNLRLDGAEDRLSMDKPTYQDIRDDRVYTYFDIAPGSRKTFKVLLTASYAGTYYLPSVSCEAMYDRTVYARKRGMEVNVVKQVNQ